MASRDGDDMTMVGSGVPDYFAEMSMPLTSPRVGLVRGFFHDAVDPLVEKNFEEFVGRLKGMGCRVRDASLDWVEDAYENWLPIRKAEATAFHLKWLEASPELYGDDVRKLLEDGRGVSAVEYVSAVNARPSFMEKFASAMEPFDFLIVPCTSVTAPRPDQSKVDVGGKKLDLRSALIRLSIPFNYIGCPVLSLPSGLVGGLPVGVQVVGRLFEEGSILRLARAYEEKFGQFPRPELPARGLPTP
jgi:aspartyl-tRNA(Asn)/glutamyl-tRNA(Gln) amidotransferase subunit A